MNVRRFAVSRTAAVQLALLLAAGSGDRRRAVGAAPDPLEPRVVAGKVVSASGSLLGRHRADKGFQYLDEGESVHSRDTLLALPGVKGALESAGKSVRLSLWGNLPQLSAFPGLQSAVI